MSERTDKTIKLIRGLQNVYGVPLQTIAESINMNRVIFYMKLNRNFRSKETGKRHEFSEKELAELEKKLPLFYELNKKIHGSN